MHPEISIDLPPTTYTLDCNQEELDLLLLVASFMPRLGHPEITVTYSEVNQGSYKATIINSFGAGLGLFWNAYRRAGQLLATKKIIEFSDLFTEAKRRVASRSDGRPRRHATSKPTQEPPKFTDHQLKELARLEQTMQITPDFT